MSPRSIYIARHGETESNLAGLYAGRNAEPLTIAGRAQVLRLAEDLCPEHIGQVWTSSVRRAVESAQLLGDRLAVPVSVDARLDEMDLGPWEGRTEEEVARDFPEAHALWLTHPDQVRLDGRETLAQVTARVLAAVADAEVAEAPVLLMTHVAPIRVAVLTALRYPLAVYKRVQVPNASCVQVDRTGQQAAWVPQGASLRVEIERTGSVAA